MKAKATRNDFNLRNIEGIGIMQPFHQAIKSSFSCIGNIGEDRVFKLIVDGFQYSLYKIFTKVFTFDIDVFI